MLTLLTTERSFNPDSIALAERHMGETEWPRPTMVVVGFASPTLLCGLESVIAGSSSLRLAASAQCLQDFLSACARLSKGVAIVDPALARHSMREFLDACRLAAPGVRIVLMTDEHQPHTVREAVRHGASGLVDKTASSEVIRAAIAAAANGQRYISPSISTHLADSLTLEELTRRETDVLVLLSRGHCNKTIARDLDVTVGTVKTHVRAIMGKLDSRSRTEVVLKAYRLGLVGLDR
jgi:DNA-binding NarL/FixJ family response regulator